MQHLACQSVQPLAWISQSRFCFWKEVKACSASPKVSLQLSFKAEGRSQAAPGSAHCLNCFCTVSSWWLQFTANRLLKLVYFGAVFAPQSDSGGLAVRSSALPSICRVRRNLFPNTLRNGVYSQTEYASLCACHLHRTPLPCTSQVSAISEPSPVVFLGPCSELVHSCKVQLNGSLLNFILVTKTATEDLTELSPSFPLRSEGKGYFLPIFACGLQLAVTTLSRLREEVWMK